MKLIVAGQTDVSFELDQGPNTIGRIDPETGATPDINLEAYDSEAKVSRSHAVITLTGEDIVIEDQESLNGTYINRGERLMPLTPHKLDIDDEIIIGKTVMKLVAG